MIFLNDVWQLLSILDNVNWEQHHFMEGSPCFLMTQDACGINVGQVSSMFVNIYLSPLLEGVPVTTIPCLSGLEFVERRPCAKFRLQNLHATSTSRSELEYLGQVSFSCLQFFIRPRTAIAFAAAKCVIHWRFQSIQSIHPAFRPHPFVQYGSCILSCVNVYISCRSNESLPCSTNRSESKRLHGPRLK